VIPPVTLGLNRLNSSKVDSGVCVSTSLIIMAPFHVQRFCNGAPLNPKLLGAFLNCVSPEEIVLIYLCWKKFDILRPSGD